MSIRTKPQVAHKKRDLGSMVSTAFTVAVAVGLVSMAINAVRKRLAPDDNSNTAEAAVRLVGDGERTMTLTPAMVGSFGLRTTQARSSEARPELVLFGSLFIDPSRMVRVHSRFSGEVVGIGQITPSAEEDGTASAVGAPGSTAVPGKRRPLRAGDSVHKGDLLAIVLSKDVGEKKSDLVDALSQLYLDRANIDRLHKLEEGIVPKRQVREAEHKFEADQIAVDTIERTLRSWRLTEKEINDVRAEAEKLHKDQRGHDRSLDKTWAEVDVKAPFDAVILEKNATVGDIVDTNLDLFKLADLTTLGVWADAYEEDLPAIEAIPTDERNWMIHVEADPRPPLPGTYDTIGQIIKPEDHKAPIIGWVTNMDNRLRAGQFITATIDLPSSDSEVAIPRTALIDEGTRSIVFVASDETGTTVTQRQVAVARPSHDVVYIRCHPSERERELGCQELLPGQWVVSSGTVELASALEDLIINVAAQAQTTGGKSPAAAGEHSSTMERHHD